MADLIVKQSSDPEVLAAQERVKTYRELDKGEHDDLVDAGIAETALRTELGDADYYQGVRMIESYLDTLPAAERDRIETTRLPDGSLKLLDPTYVRELGRKALGPLPTDPEGINAELEASRKRMRDDSKGWYADDKAQMRYRILLRLKGA